VADQAVRIGPAAPADSYLSIPALVDAAAKSEADAIRPGYGFLSERPELPRACAQAGITFIGPPAEVMERMGSKIGARALMHGAGVPIVPGDTPHDQSDQGVLAAARGLGYPVLVKASAGGGGKGMRVVTEDGDAIAAIGAARREAVAAFGDGTLYVERRIERPRHIEVQIFADSHGNVVHLFERECSVQRRHQKVIEESPSPAVSAELRRRMTVTSWNIHSCVRWCCLLATVWATQSRSPKRTFLAQSAKQRKISGNQRSSFSSLRLCARNLYFDSVAFA
jgi:acetyl/propionyl-CoA carboxylase alpha subunit